MAQSKLTHDPFSGSEKRNFREFEQFKSMLAVTATPAIQRANILRWPLY